jgi:hypothetical protein
VNFAAGYNEIVTDSHDAYYALTYSEVDYSALSPAPATPIPSMGSSTVIYGVFDLAVDSRSVYATTSSPNYGVAACPVGATCTSLTLLTSGFAFEPSALYADGTYVWIGGQDLYKCTAGMACANPPTGLGTGTSPLGIVSDGLFVYWVDGAHGVMRCPAASTSCTPTILSTVAAMAIAQSPAGVVPAAIYFSDGSSVYLLAK